MLIAAFRYGLLTILKYDNGRIVAEFDNGESLNITGSQMLQYLAMA